MSDDITGSVSGFARGEPLIRIPPFGGAHGYPRCWYPVALADSLAPGEVREEPFLDGAVSVFRGESGTPYVVSPYCRHLGAKLTAEGGRVKGERLHCPFHFWGYDGADGRCTYLPTLEEGEPIPEQARIFAYPTREHVGLIWAFNGVQADLPLPYWPVPGDAPLEIRTKEGGFEENDTFVLITNAVDVTHLKHVHGLPFAQTLGPLEVNMAEGRIGYDQNTQMPDGEWMASRIEVFGTNVFTAAPIGSRPVDTSEGPPALPYFFAANCPLPGRRNKSYDVVAVPAPGDDPEARERAESAFALGQMIGDKLKSEDRPIIDTMEFRPDVLTRADAAIRTYLEYVRDFPRTHPGREFIGRA